MKRVHGLLCNVGREIGKAYCVVVGLALLLGFPVVGILVSIYLGITIAQSLGAGTLVGVLGLVIAFLFGLFLGIYVWQPYVKSRMFRAYDIMLNFIENE